MHVFVHTLSNTLLYLIIIIFTPKDRMTASKESTDQYMLLQNSIKFYKNILRFYIHSLYKSPVQV